MILREPELPNDDVNQREPVLVGVLLSHCVIEPVLLLLTSVVL